MSSRVIIITGASRGIGLSATEFLLREGARVVAVQRSITPELSSLVEKYPTALRIVQGDSSDDATILRAVTESQETFGSINGVVFNAGTMPDIAPVAQLSMDDWLTTFNVNLFGVVRLLRAVLPVLKAGAKLVFVSSASSSVLALPAAGPYSASKAALDSLNRTLAAEHADKVCIAYLPGPVKTKMRDEFIAALKPFLSPEMATHYDSFPEILPEVPGRNRGCHSCRNAAGTRVETDCRNEVAFRLRAVTTPKLQVETRYTDPQQLAFFDLECLSSVK